MKGILAAGFGDDMDGDMIALIRGGTDMVDDLWNGLARA